MSKIIGNAFVCVGLLWAASAAAALEYRAEDPRTPHDHVYVSELSKNQIISADDLRKKQVAGEDFLLLDARNKSAYDAAHIAGAKLSLPDDFFRQEQLFKLGIIPKAPDMAAALSQTMAACPPGKSIVTYCNANCAASAVLLMRLQALGFTNVRAMEQGIQVWEKKGYPVIKAAVN